MKFTVEYEDSIEDNLTWDDACKKAITYAQAIDPRAFAMPTDSNNMVMYFVRRGYRDSKNSVQVALVRPTKRARVKSKK